MPLHQFIWCLPIRAARLLRHFAGTDRTGPTFVNPALPADITVAVADHNSLPRNGSPYATGPLSCLSVTLVYCGQTVGWINMPLGTEVGLGPGDNVLDGEPALTRKGVQHSPPTFWSMSY